eukprot:TRINITY_DN1925_c0_g1_i1.p1 TRINITY_DN1925_c0_g1~~TRINITY_DN1925_c0_g1_i1.p1  ORF type:complete len:253 (+),score=54.52 TRINITY_DN1925_c0_g1_i1:164-922(+)
MRPSWWMLLLLGLPRASLAIDRSFSEDVSLAHDDEDQDHEDLERAEDDDDSDSDSASSSTSDEMEPRFKARRSPKLRRNRSAASVSVSVDDKAAVHRDTLRHKVRGEAAERKAEEEALDAARHAIWAEEDEMVRKAQEGVNEADTDQDNRLSKKEMIDAFMKDGEPDLAEYVEKTFDDHDTDGDGVLDAVELRNMAENYRRDHDEEQEKEEESKAREHSGQDTRVPKDEAAHQQLSSEHTEHGKQSQLEKRH